MGEVIPSIKRSWPRRKDNPIFIQQNNAPAHKSGTDQDVVSAGRRYGWNINLVNQPANSPDSSVLELGLFRAMDAATRDHEMRTVE